ncbi:uncharacterized protein LOC6569292 [Drosophila grimshawi]|uniref:GH17918 n=1 Tax=Drosophila grimshawi TaxID=7222 RepID=B4JXB9_DROGR|nr:uncharacterized protein LOC6569292 [Drosophila grimshawi]EDV95395.1 GH17918 [Drosophila grimshawi]
MSEKRGLGLPINARASIFVPLLLVLPLLLQLAEVSAYRALLPADPANLGKCIYRGDELKLGINNGIPPCQRLTCNEDGSMLVEGCGKVRFQKCNQGERIHQTDPFPDCCLLRYKCKRADGTSHHIEWNTAVGA